MMTLLELMIARTNYLYFYEDELFKLVYKD